MKNIFLSLIVVTMLISPGVSDEKSSSLEIPMLALKALGESRVDDCQYCVENLEKSAFRILDRYFVPGRVFLFDGREREDLLIKRGTLKAGELLPSQYTVRERGKNGDGKKFEFPLVVFFFHTSKHHNAGISKEKFTPDAVDSVYLKKYRKSGVSFKGRIRIIEYPYGNGKSFIYFRARNVLQVHCRVERLHID